MNLQQPATSLNEPKTVGVTGDQKIEPLHRFAAAYSSPAYTPFPSRPSSAASNVASDDVVADVAILTTSSLRSRHYELVPANEFDDSVSSTVRKINDPTKFSTCVEMAVLQSTSESRKSARTTLRNVAEDRGQIIQVTKRFFDQLNCIDG